MLLVDSTDSTGSINTPDDTGTTVNTDTTGNTVLYVKMSLPTNNTSLERWLQGHGQKIPIIVICNKVSFIHRQIVPYSTNNDASLIKTFAKLC